MKLTTKIMNKFQPNIFFVGTTIPTGRYYLKKGSNNHEQNELDTKSVTGTILCNVMGANLLALLEGDSRIYSQQLSSLRSVLFKGLAATA